MAIAECHLGPSTDKDLSLQQAAKEDEPVSKQKKKNMGSNQRRRLRKRQQDVDGEGTTAELADVDDGIPQQPEKVATPVQATFQPRRPDNSHEAAPQETLVPHTRQAQERASQTTPMVVTEEDPESEAEEEAVLETPFDYKETILRIVKACLSRLTRDGTLTPDASILEKYGLVRTPWLKKWDTAEGLAKIDKNTAKLPPQEKASCEHMTCLLYTSPSPRD